MVFGGVFDVFCCILVVSEVFCGIPYGRGGQKITTITTTPVLVARGGQESSNPATTTTHSGRGVKETHNYTLWE